MMFTEQEVQAIRDEVCEVLDRFPLHIAEGILERLHENRIAYYSYFEQGTWGTSMPPCVGCFYGSIVLELGDDWDADEDALEFAMGLRRLDLIDCQAGKWGMTPVEKYLDELSDHSYPRTLVDIVEEYVKDRRVQHFCPKCGVHWATHNGDGSCVED